MSLEVTATSATPRALKTNVAINVLGAIIPLFVALVTVPIYVHHIGDARYGVLSIVWVLLGYFGFLDLGLSRAAANALAKLRDAPQSVRARVLVTALALNIALGIVGSLCLFILGGYFLLHVVALPESLKPEIVQAFPWVVGLFPLALVSGVGIGALESRERFLLANVLQVAGTSLGQIVPVTLAVAVSPSLAVLVPAAVMTRALTLAAILITVYHDEGPLSILIFDSKQARRLLSYGGWITVSSLISPILVSLDQFVIGSVLGVVAVTHYSVPMSLVLRSQVFAGALSRTLFPRMSNSGPEDARRLASRALMSLAYGYGAICAPAIVVTPAFFRYWIGADFSLVAAPVAEILFFGAWINGLAFIPYGLLQGQGRPSVTGKLHLAEVLPFVGILWSFTSAFGISGAAAAWSLRCAVDACCLFWASGLERRTLIIALAPPLLLLASSASLAWMIGTSLSEALSTGAVVGAVAVVMALREAPDLKRVALAGSSSILRVVRTRFNGGCRWPRRK